MVAQKKRHGNATRQYRHRDNTGRPSSRGAGGGSSSGGTPSLAAAVPEYVGRVFSDAPPGHRFNLYFEGWKTGDWTLAKEKKVASLRRVLSLADGEGLLSSFLERQNSLFNSFDRNCSLNITAISTSPFVTGMGIEHPIENGFTFLNPYGLPCLTGSGVKGVVRRAAEELALLEQDNRDWSLLDVWYLFGFDATSAYLNDPPADCPDAVRDNISTWREAYNRKKSELSTNCLLKEYIKMSLPEGELPTGKKRGDYEKNLGEFLDDIAADRLLARAIHNKGVISFWDVLPRPPENKMGIEIMTPHYSGYYQQDRTPADCGQPNPIPFLVVPAKSEFRFYLFCNQQLLPQPLCKNWRSRIEAAFHHAFDWLGFGAKTAVGYGAMRISNTTDAAQSANPPTQTDTAMAGEFYDKASDNQE